ncbi:MAG: antibiotic biosynthesis monooxygenase [Candidatus Woesearchaeota archaeon]
MIVGYALFKVKKGTEKFALKHMRNHLQVSQQVKGFIHGYIAKAIDEEHRYLVIEEYETYDALYAAQQRLQSDSNIKPDEYIKFNKIMQDKPRYEIFRKKEFTQVKISDDYKSLLTKMKEKKLIMKGNVKKSVNKAMKSVKKTKKAVRKKKEKIT